ncbi:MAG: cell wall-binding repeat-containing protein, partial [Coriobacteriia bacterium]|nr:cell wall-binding repeat-containing protein [Coriobacteriia bacterium]
VETMLKSAGIKTITRVAGSNRYSTARLVAQAAIKKANGGWDGTALVATGRNFPDALAGSSLAANRLWPIYLADPDAAPSVLAANMKADGVRRVIILGGTSAVSSPYESALEAAIPDTVRLSGADRYATGVEIVRYGVTSAGLVWDGMSVATGANFPDALAGGMLAAKKRSLIVLTSGTALTPCVRTELEQAANEIGTVYYLGGTGALSSAVRNEIDATLR